MEPNAELRTSNATAKGTVSGGRPIMMATEGRTKTPAELSGRSNDRLAFLDALKATGIVMVVAVHALTRVEVSPSSRELVGFLVGAAAVPLFFLTDGFLLSMKRTETSPFEYGRFISKSAVRLLVPWAAFTLLYAVVRVVLENYEFTREKILMGKDFLGVIQVIYLSGVSPHMYFLLSLFLVRLGAGALHKLLRWPLWAWMTIGVFYVGLYQMSHPKEWFLPGADPVLLACWGGQFYILGIVLQKGQLFVKSHTMQLLSVGAGLTIGLRIFILPDMGIIVQFSYLIAIYAALLLVSDLTGWSFSIGRDSMGIYLLHTPLIVWMAAELVNRIVPSGQAGALALATCVTVLASWYAAKTMSKSVVGRLLMGHSGPNRLKP